MQASKIPAMTSDAERECYYRLAREAAPKGTVIELGPWLGASTTAIAAGIRDSGVRRKALVYDRFKLNSDHLRKAKKFGAELSEGPCLETFKANLGPLMEYVEPHAGEIVQELAKPVAGNSVSLLICDAPKRVPQISAVLTALSDAMQVRSIMAWQDFCHFPSYEIPACLYRIRNHIEFVEAVVPGTTMVFRVKSQWSEFDVSPKSLALQTWSVNDIFEAWRYWREFVAPPKEALFECGLPLFLCDIGYDELAARELGSIYERASDSIVKKWRYLRESRPDFLTRYQPLFDYLESQGVFETESV